MTTVETMKPLYPSVIKVADVLGWELPQCSTSDVSSKWAALTWSGRTFLQQIVPGIDRFTSDEQAEVLESNSWAYQFAARVASIVSKAADVSCMLTSSGDLLVDISEDQPERA